MSPKPSWFKAPRGVVVDKPILMRLLSHELAAMHNANSSVVHRLRCYG